MSATVADPYRGFTINGPHHANRKDSGHEDLIAYNTPQSRSRLYRPMEASFHSDATHLPSYSPQLLTNVAGVRHTASPSAQHEPQSVFMGTPRMSQLPRSTQYTASSFELSTSPKGRTRSWSEKRDSSDNRSTGTRESMQSVTLDGPVPTSSEMLFPVHGNPSLSHSSSHHGYAFSASLPLPQHHHHHRLPPHASLHLIQSPGLDPALSSFAGGPPCMVGQPGMPDPSPRPLGPKHKFTPEDDALLVELKETRNLTWRQIADFFPGRTSGTLQVRYCTKLKAKDVIWTDETVQRLQRAIEEYENDRWRIIAGKVGNGFTPVACRERASQL